MEEHRLLIHCNAGNEFGMGHLMRCLAIAEEAAGRDWQVEWAGDLDERALSLIATQAAGLVHRLPVAHAPARLAELVGRGHQDVLHLDTYWLPPDAVPRGARLLSSMQDGSYGVVRADLAIDANLGAEDRLAGPALSRHYLLGSSATVIRRQVVRQRSRPGPGGDRRRVLVVIGGTDPLGLTAGVVQALEGIEVPIDVTVVTPRGQADGLASVAAQSRHRVDLVDFLTDLPAVAREHHLVISAAGTSVWDFACMGVPMALLPVVDNQRDGYLTVVDAGLAIGLGLPPHDDLGTRVAGLADVLFDTDALRVLADRGRAVIDGLGTWRIVSAWEQLLASEPTRPPLAGLRARPATMDDAAMLHRWRNDPATRLASRSQEEVAWDHHLAWLGGSLGRADRRLLVVEQNGIPVGTVRWDHEGGRDWEVSITVAPEARGRRLAVPLLRAGEQALAVTGTVRLLASIHRDNTASVKLFQAAGYLPYLPPDANGFLTTARWALA